MYLIIGVVLFCVTVYLLERIIRSFKVDGFGQKYVFITGCDSGFGRRLAMRLDSLGFPVFAACLTDEGQQYLSQHASSRLTTSSLDVTEVESIKKALDFVKQKLPQGSGLWALVNNAGIIGPIVPLEMCPLEGFHKTCAVNMFGPIEMCRHFMPLIRKSTGRIINVSSAMGRIASVSPAYCTSKFGLEGFSDYLRREVYGQGIKVSILEPGYFRTNFIAGDETIKKDVSHYYDQADDEVQTVFGDVIGIVSTGFRMGKSASNANLDLVVDALIHAIVSRFPKTRYVIGWDAVLFFIPLSYFPGGLADWLLAAIIKISKWLIVTEIARNKRSQ